MDYKKIKSLSNGELLDEYNEVKNRISRVLEGCFGGSDLIYLEELIKELVSRENF